MSDEAEIDDLAMTAVTRLFLENGGHRLERISPDLGRDARLIFKSEGGARGYATSLQVKGTRNTDTESALGFKFELDVQNICYLTDDILPAYYVIHNCEAETTYVRSAHEIANWLDVCRKGWREQKTVTVTFKAKSPLSPAEIVRMAAEAEAWAAEKRTTKEIVEGLEAALAHYAKPKSEMVKDGEGSFMWMRFRGGFHISGAADSIGVLLFMSHLGHGYSLCYEFRRRTEKLLQAHEVMITGLGTMDLAGLTARLKEAKARHTLLEAELGDCLKRAAPEPREVEERVQATEPGLMHPKVEDLDAGAALAALRKFLEQLGLSILDSADPLDLVVRCGDAVGLVSLDIYGRTADHTRYQAIRERMAMVGARAGVAFIKLCQFESLMLNTWPRPATDPTPTLPIGTVAPNLEDFLAALLKTAGAGPWRATTVTATEIPRSEMGFSCRMPVYIKPESDNASWYQREIVRRHMLEAVEARKPFAFVFGWGSDRTELYLMSSPEDLVAFALAGPERFRTLGGQFHQCGRGIRTSQDPDGLPGA